MALRAFVVVNPVAPHVDRARLTAALRAAFPEPGATEVVESPSEPDGARALAAMLVRAHERGCDLAIAAGGDGTVSLLADAFARLGVRDELALAIVPLGTGNVLARELGIPIDLQKSISLAAARPHAVTLDAITLERRWFLTQVGVGFDAAVIGETSRAAQTEHGRLAYVRPLLHQAFGWRSHRYVLELDGRIVRTRAWQIIVANAGIFAISPFTWGPGIDPRDGQLDVCVYDVQRFRDTLTIAWRILARRHRRDRRARFYRVREVTIRSSTPLPVHGDGEVIGHTPITMRILPSAIRIVAPAPDGVVPPASPSGAGSNGHRALPGKVSMPASTPGTAEHHTIEIDPATVDRARHDRHLRVRLAGWDAAAFFAVNHLPGGVALDRAMAALSHLMDHGEGWILLAGILALAHRPEGLRIPVRVVPALWLAMLIVNFPIKSLFRRRRPFIVHERARVRGLRPSDTSFPSGHTAAAFAGAVLLAPYLGPFAALAFAYAFAVGFSRIYLGVHYPSDVGMGAILGTALGIMFALLTTVLGLA